MLEMINTYRVVHKTFYLDDSVSDSIFQESDAAASFKEIRRKDPYDEMSFDFSFHKLMSAFQQLPIDQLFSPLNVFAPDHFL